MKRLYIILLVIGLSPINGQTQIRSIKPEQTVFAFGGDINQKFVQYVVALTNKQNPKVCYIPTASADNEENIKYWNFICKKLSIEPYVLKVWVSSGSTFKTFEEILLSMDAIVVGGGNTLNMMGIWEAQGIDDILNKALKKGIILAGGSAGSICWFQNGISDSRPVNLSVVNGLAYLPYSSCPHYSDSLRKGIYHRQIKGKKIKSGYACDDLSGVLFKNGKFVEAVSINDINNSYFVSLKNGAIHSQKLKSKILINKDALPVTAYAAIDVNKTVKYFSEMYDQDTPLNAFISLKYIFANGQESKHKQVASYYLKDRLSDTASDIKVDESRKNKFLNTTIDKVLIYKDSVAGVINKMNKDFYGLWYFYNENGKWMSAGEDIGGETIYEAEITFREKAKMHIEKVQKLSPDR
ncbi:MAG: peptidase E [Rikenellaceae bacterium]